jgi:hypothetical protein
MIDRQDAIRHAELGASMLAEADPLRAAKVLARGLRLQPRGGQLACLRAFVQQLIAADPAIASAITADLTGALQC